jgi:hypothetical protein
MKKKKIFLVLVLIVFLNSLVWAIEKPDKKNDELFSTQNQEIFCKPFLPIGQSILTSFTFQDLGANNPDLKSSKKGLLFSILIPGSGELYAGSLLKGILFLGIEVTAWTTYASNKKKGEDLKIEFKQYAEEHWSKTGWDNWWNSLPEDTKQQWAHHQLPETKTQQYYEMIGKYQKFNAGWDDVILANALSDTSKIGRIYMNMRGKSNDKLKLATSMTGIAFANHILSALDAVWSVNRFNKKIQPRVRVKHTMVNNKPVPVANFAINW